MNCVWRPFNVTLCSDISLLVLIMMWGNGSEREGAKSAGGGD